jgi:NADPH-dependent ferric siderophore reductase
MRRVTLAGVELEGLAIEQPAASVRLLLPPPGEAELVMPGWDGNLFLLPDGSRAPIRTFTPRRLDRRALELDIDIVLHGQGVASGWAGRVEPGDEAAVSGPARGYDVEADAPAFFLGGDETAIPAIGQLLEVLPHRAAVEVRVEVAHPDARVELPHHPLAEVEWLDLPSGALPGDALVGAVREADLAPGTRVWVAGEAAAVQRIRRHLFDEREMSRREATVRGYWKHGRTGDGDGDGS